MIFACLEGDEKDEYMGYTIKSQIKELLQEYVPSWLETYKRKKEIMQWQKLGKPLPPPHAIKQQAIILTAHQYSIDTLVETGTYLGEMVLAQRRNFKKIISIELFEDLFKKAKNRFLRFPHIDIIYGDSGEVLHTLVKTLDGPCIFWLDGHYSGQNTAKGFKETPIMQELQAILKSPFQHVILIDDARMFDGRNDYPTLEQVFNFAHVLRTNYSIEISDDIIRLLP